MDATNQALFQLMRFNVLDSLTQESSQRRFPNAYIYAWEVGVFPLLHCSADWHRPFPDQFDVNELEMGELQKFLYDANENGAPNSFYEVEDHFDVRGIASSDVSSNRWDRLRLVSACRYMFSSECLESELFEALLENGSCPSEAHCLNASWRDDEVSFI